MEELKLNKDNPRNIKEDVFEKLKSSLKEFPKMMKLRPIIIDENNIILGGNMRYKALQELGYKEIPDEWVKKETELNEKEKEEFIIKDNIAFGQWDFDLLSKWDLEKLENWNLFIPNIDKINELEEWDGIEGIEDFEIPKDKIGIHIYFNSEEEREQFAKEKGLVPTRKRKNIWIIKE